MITIGVYSYYKNDGVGYCLFKREKICDGFYIFIWAVKSILWWGCVPSHHVCISLSTFFGWEIKWWWSCFALICSTWWWPILLNWHIIIMLLIMLFLFLVEFSEILLELNKCLWWIERKLISSHKAFCELAMLVQVLHSWEYGGINESIFTRHKPIYWLGIVTVIKGKCLCTTNVIDRLSVSGTIAACQHISSWQFFVLPLLRMLYIPKDHATVLCFGHHPS